MRPARQRLEGADGAGAGVDHRLEPGLDLAFGDGAVDLLGEIGAPGDLLAERGGEMAAAPAPFRLGAIEREVGIVQQFLGAGGVPRIDRDADRGADRHQLLLEQERPVEAAAQLLRDQLHLAGVGDVLAQHDELVAADPRHQTVRGNLEAQLLGDIAQQAVTDRVALEVVHFLEVVEIDPQHRAQRAAFIAAGDGGIEPLAQHLAVRQAGQRVMMGEETEAVVGALAVLNVVDHQQMAGAATDVEGPRRDGDAAHDPIGAHQFGLQRHLVAAEQPVDGAAVGKQLGDEEIGAGLALETGNGRRRRG